MQTALLPVWPIKVVFDLTDLLGDWKLAADLHRHRQAEVPQRAGATRAGSVNWTTLEGRFGFACAGGCREVVGVGLNTRVARCLTLLMVLLPFIVTGCSTFVAHRMVQAPNTYPSWFAPRARVLIAFDEHLLTNSPAQYADVGPPAARLQYRVIEPADYDVQSSSTNWLARGKLQYQFHFRAAASPRTNRWTTAPRGTVFLLHGYGLAEFSMAPWAWRLAQAGWRCVLVDLRGHGKSTGRQIYWGLTETRDLSQLLHALENQGQLARPVAVMGESYGAALALRWKTTEPRVGPLVAIAPYGVLSNAVLNICADYAGFLPRPLIRSGVARLPAVLGVPAGELDTSAVLARHPVAALFVTGSEDDIIPPAEVRSLFAEALPGSELIVVPGATHETVPYRFGELVPSVLAWLDAGSPAD